MKPDYPDLPPGYPDKAPSKKAALKFKRQKNSDAPFQVKNAEFKSCQQNIFDPDEWCKYMAER